MPIEYNRKTSTYVRYKVLITRDQTSSRAYVTHTRIYKNSAYASHQKRYKIEAERQKRQNNREREE